VIKLGRDNLGEDGVMEGFSAEIHDEVFKGQFPNQRVSVEKLLHMNYRDRIWTDRTKPDVVQYVHVPCNNMSVRSPQYQKPILLLICSSGLR
jgi:hypothetical protein